MTEHDSKPDELHKAVKPDPPAARAYDNNWPPFTRRVVALVLSALTLLVLALYAPLFTSILLAVVVVAINLGPSVWLARRTRLTYGQSVGVSYLVYLVLAITLVLFLLIPALDFLAVLLVDFGRFLDQLASSLREHLTSINPGTEQMLLTYVLDVLTRVAAVFDTTVNVLLVDLVALVLGGVAATVGSLLNLLLQTLFIHILALFMLLELPSIVRWIIHTFDQQSRREYTILAQRMVRVIGNYLRSAGLSILISAIAASIMLLVLGVPNAVLVAFLASLFIMIPVIGGYMGGFLVLLSAAIGGTTLLNLDSALMEGIATWIIYTLLQGIFISNFIEPRLYSDALSIPVIVILPTLVLAGASLGLLGMLLVVPLLGFSKEALTYVFRKLKGGDPYPDEPPDIVRLEQFLAAIGVPGGHEVEQSI